MASGFLISSAFVRVTADTTRAVGGLTAVTLAAGAAGAALSVLPALGASIGGIGGVIAASFSGVGEALKGFQADQKAATATSGRSAAQETSNARQIRDAQRSIADARRDQARAAKESQKAVDDATRNQVRAAKEAAKAVADAERSQSRTARAGAEAITKASEQVADALEDEREAQEGLTEARKDATRQLEDMRERVSDFAMDSQQAADAVAEAEQELTLVMADATSSDVERRRAQNDLADAREKVADLAREQARATEDLTEAEAKGVEGSDQVVKVQDRITDAADKRKKAEENLARVTREAGEANQDAARAVAEAVEQGNQRQQDAARAVAEAVEQGNQRQADAARGVSDALQGLRDAQDTQAASAYQGAAANSAYADAMARLLPSQRELVEQLIRMGPLVAGLQAASADSFLPGLTQMLRDSEGLFPIFEGYLRTTGTQMGDTARQFGTMFKSDEFKANLEGTLAASKPITQSILDGILGITGAWFELGANSGPAADGFANGLDRLFGGIEGLFENLEPHMDSFGTLWEGILGGLGDVLPGIGTALGIAADALVFMAPVIGPVVGGLIGLLVAGKIVSLIYGMITAFTLLQALWALSPFGVILIAIGALVGAFIGAYATSETFRNIVNGALRSVGEFFGWVYNSLIKPAFEGIGASAKWVYENMLRPAFEGMQIGLRAVGDFFGWVYHSLIKPAFDGIGGAARWVYENMLRPAFTGMQNGLRAVGDFFNFVYNALIRPAFDGIGRAAQFVWNNILRPAFDGIGRGVDGMGRAFQNTADWIARSFNSLREAARAPVQWVVDVVYNNGIRRVWNGIAGVFGLGQLAEVRFATGGIMPGYTPGRDVHLAALSGGEAVMRPEWTRAAGADYVNGANKAARVGGVSGAAAYIDKMGLPGYAEGGIVGDIWNKASGFIGSLFGGDPAGAVRSLFEGVLGDSGRTPGQGMWRQALVSIPGKLIGAAIEAAKKWLSGNGGGKGVGGALAFAKAQAGKPYGWGAVGPGSYDCSGFMSAIANVINGKNPYSRLGATATFPWSGFRVGMGSPFMVGSSKNTGSGIGHMAGTLAGINVESRGGGVGVLVGGRARGVNDSLFNTRAGMVMDTGGRFPAGMVALNDSGRPEQVLNPRQTEAFEDWMRGKGEAGGNHTFYVSIDARSVAELRDVTEFIAKIQQTARKGPARVAGVVAR